ncbi:MAG TPA: hypothetical protein VER03_12640 [Bryobacteraceae bacterium]|nr:hypothetical protein [Bryobacteraceae bacterium]
MDLYRHAAYTQHLLHTASGGLNSRMLAGYCGWLTCFLPWVALTPIAFGRGAGSRSTTLDGPFTSEFMPQLGSAWLVWLHG